MDGASEEPVIVAVRAATDEQEIETHVRWGDVRTIGRAATVDGLAGAVSALLDALRQHGLDLDLEHAWTRTTETTADGRFTVAAGLRGPSSFARGTGTGLNPMEAAARAALDAVLRARDA